MACPISTLASLMLYSLAMDTKSRSQTSKPEAARPLGKRIKGTTETARLFLDVAQVNRKSMTQPLTRYVE